MTLRAIRGRCLSFSRAPEGAGDAGSYRYVANGAVVMDGGRITAVGEAAATLKALPAGTPVDDHRDALILPGLIDTHIHIPQTQVIASYGAQLLDWLKNYTFPAEQRYGEAAFADAMAGFFVDELLRNGTTTAVSYGSVHPQSAEAAFAAATRRGMGLIAGKSMMDRGAPPALLDTTQSSYDQTKALIARWHGRGRQRCVVTVRFALTSTPAQMDAAGALLREHPGVYFQTHLSENRAEIEAVRADFPDAIDYTDVYDRHGLLGPRSLFGHCIHLSDRELDRLAATRSVAVFCPTSNLFIGSGLFDLARTAGRGVRVGLATDVGGGTSYSMLRTAAEAYKVLQLQGQSLSALAAFDRMTRGNAAALNLDGEIGVIAPGAFGDLVVLDARATPAMAHRMERAESLEDELFVLMTLGDDRAVRATYVAGEPAGLQASPDSRR